MLTKKVSSSNFEQFFKLTFAYDFFQAKIINEIEKVTNPGTLLALHLCDKEGPKVGESKNRTRVQLA